MVICHGPKERPKEHVSEGSVQRDGRWYCALCRTRGGSGIVPKSHTVGPLASSSAA